MPSHTYPSGMRGMQLAGGPTVRIAAVVAITLGVAVVSTLPSAPAAADGSDRPAMPAAESQQAKSTGAAHVTRTVPAGTVLTPAMVTGPGAAQFVGQQTRRSLWPNRVIHPGDVGPPHLVERNAAVEMIFSRGPVELRGEGRALQAGGLGERIRVMNADSRKVVRATVTGPGMVEVKP